eukprot:10184163-Lingulodinium_polyedra.AAC.1
MATQSDRTPPITRCGHGCNAPPRLRFASNHRGSLTARLRTPHAVRALRRRRNVESTAPLRN